MNPTLTPFHADLTRGTPGFFLGPREAPLPAGATAVGAAGIRSPLCGWITPQNVVRSLVKPTDQNLERAAARLIPILKLFDNASVEISAEGVLLLGVRAPGADGARIIGRRPYRPFRSLTIVQQGDRAFRQRLAWDFDTGVPGGQLVDLPGGYSIEIFLEGDRPISFASAVDTTIQIPILEARVT